METNNATVTLGKTVYTVVGPLKESLYLRGPRGGESHLQQNRARPQYWAHITMSGYRAKSTWYVRNDDGSFSEVK
jgi:hypothetical protein